MCIKLGFARKILICVTAPFAIRSIWSLLTFRGSRMQGWRDEKKISACPWGKLRLRSTCPGGVYSYLPGFLFSVCRFSLTVTDKRQSSSDNLEILWTKESSFGNGIPGTLAKRFGWLCILQTIQFTMAHQSRTTRARQNQRPWGAWPSDVTSLVVLFWYGTSFIHGRQPEIIISEQPQSQGTESNLFLRPWLWQKPAKLA